MIRVRLWVLGAGLLLGAGMLLGGCSGESATGECSQGQTKLAEDGCNSCSCTAEGEWSCTAIDCAEPCQDGETQPAGDDCNTCTCMDSRWTCTRKACDPPDLPGKCPEPREPDPDKVCAQVIVVAKDPESGACCTYGNACVAPEGWQTYSNEEQCEGESPCEPGETRPAGDGCNTCSCTEEGQWACTLEFCVDECQAGQTKRADDGCNTCTCTSDGSWSCTETACDPEEPLLCGGFAGATCTDDEYCAYTEGQYCGAADASAVCEPRPEVCTDEAATVCGCDGNTYSNACEAAASGTGVHHAGACK